MLRRGGEVTGWQCQSALPGSTPPRNIIGEAICTHEPAGGEASSALASGITGDLPGHFADRNATTIADIRVALAANVANSNARACPHGGTNLFALGTTYAMARNAAEGGPSRQWVVTPRTLARHLSPEMQALIDLTYAFPRAGVQETPLERLPATATAATNPLRQRFSQGVM